MIEPQSTRWFSRLRPRLLAWFAEHARDLPWRREPTPYRVWVSEIMCQQTQVATVLPYFERFLARYPDAETLAAADETELMRIWEGLGYYRRARSMHAAAKEIVARHGGEFPLNYADALALPGIGRYTAGAILSIADNQRTPILEGNTIRVFSRLMGMRESVDEKTSRDRLWQFAEQLLPKRFKVDDRDAGPASMNQAAMELGALVCTPRDPKCLICPLATCCQANATGTQNEIPAKTQRIAYEARNEFAFLITGPAQTPAIDQHAAAEQCTGRSLTWLVRQIPGQARFAGMWDFPKAGPPEVEDADGLAIWLSEQIGSEVHVGERATEIKHAVTKYRITLRVFFATLTTPAGISKKRVSPEVSLRASAETSTAGGSPGPQPAESWAFLTADELRHLPMSTTGRHLLAWAENRAQIDSFG